MCQLRSIRHDIPVTHAHSRGIWPMASVWPQRWQTFGGPRYKIWDWVVWPTRSRAMTSSALVKCLKFFGGPSVSRDRGLYHVQLHPTWFEPAAKYRSWPVASNLYSGQLPVGLCLSQGSVLWVGPLFHFPQCHSIQQKRTRCPCHSMTGAGSW